MASHGVTRGACQVTIISSGELKKRRAGAPAPKYEIDPNVDPSFFSDLYHVGEASPAQLLQFADVPGAHNHSLQTISYFDHTYDLQTEFIWLTPTGGVVGNRTTPLAQVTCRLHVGYVAVTCR